MGKKKKTREQKKIAELRRLKESHGNDGAISSSNILETIQPETRGITYTFSPIKSSPALSTSYSLQYDLRKTLTVSFGILLFLLILSTLLHNHTFVLPLIPLRY